METKTSNPTEIRHHALLQIRELQAKLAAQYAKNTEDLEAKTPDTLARFERKLNVWHGYLSIAQLGLQAARSATRSTTNVTKLVRNTFRSVTSVPVDAFLDAVAAFVSEMPEGDLANVVSNIEAMKEYASVIAKHEFETAAKEDEAAEREELKKTMH